MTIKELATNMKFWIAVGAAVAGVLIALGMEIDRPAWASDVEPLEQQVGMNQKMILQIQIDQVQRSIWAQEDRNTMSPTQSGKDRLRDMELHLKRLQDQKEALSDKKDG
ncbi:MAG: hypothetical protein KAI73_05090 [Rhodospirillaceae bacterium]|nr:hypothetical protein [Rhodospirillaceae bacterium]